MVAFHCVTCVGCTTYSRASCATVLSPTRASNPTLALKAALCRFRFAFINLLSLISSRPTKVYLLQQWSSFWGPPQLKSKHPVLVHNWAVPYSQKMTPTLSTRAFKYLRKISRKSGLQNTDEEIHDIDRKSTRLNYSHLGIS